MELELDALWLAKPGEDPASCQDVAAFDATGHETAPGVREVRLALSDGATSAYDAKRWARTLADGFVNDPIDPDAVEDWIARRRHEWSTARPERFASLFHEHAWARGSYATFAGICVELTTTDRAVAHGVTVGDTCVLVVRDDRLVRVEPGLGPDGFGLHPPVLHTDPARPVDVHRFTFELDEGDCMLLATDALAEWTLAHPSAASWLGRADAVDIAAETRRLIADGAMARDDVGLVRARAIATPRAVRTRFATLRGRR